MLPVITLPDETLQAIGTFVVRWNHFEAILEIVLIRMLGLAELDLKARIPFAGMGLAQRLDVLEALLQVISMTYGSVEPLQTYTQEIRPKIESLQAARNQIVHARWSYQNGTVKTLNITAKKKLKLKSEDVSTEQIDRYSENISDASNALFGLVSGDFPYKFSIVNGKKPKHQKRERESLDHV